MLITTTSRYERDNGDGTRKVWPKDWSGNLPDDLAGEIISAGAGYEVDLRTKSAPAADLEAEPATPEGGSVSGAPVHKGRVKANPAA